MQENPSVTLNLMDFLTEYVGFIKHQKEFSEYHVRDLFVNLN